VRSSTAVVEPPQNPQTQTLSSDTKYVFFRWLLTREVTDATPFVDTLQKSSTPICTTVTTLLTTTPALATNLRTVGLGNLQWRTSSCEDKRWEFTLFELHSLLNWKEAPQTTTLDKVNFSALRDLRTSSLHLPTGVFYGLTPGAAHYSRFLTQPQLSGVLEDVFKFQERQLKARRFLYNYSFLHRKIFQNITKLTNTKRLISTGFYQTEFFEKNIWASDFFSTLKNPSSFLKAQQDLRYGAFVDPLKLHWYSTDPTKTNTTYLNLGYLSSYEETFFWIFKRFMLFGGLKAQATLFTWQPAQTTTSKAVSSSEVTNFLRSNHLVNYFLAGEAVPTPFTFSNPKTLMVEMSPHDKDYDLSFGEVEFLSTDHETLLLDLLAPQDSTESPRNWYYGTSENFFLATKLNNYELTNTNSTPDLTNLIPFSFIQQTFLADLVTKVVN
jgi:hypothetical protein